MVANYNGALRYILDFSHLSAPAKTEKKNVLMVVMGSKTISVFTRPNSSGPNRLAAKHIEIALTPEDNIL